MKLLCVHCEATAVTIKDGNALCLPHLHRSKEDS
jgi:hypothetical protein